MNKRLLALAISTVVAAPAAYATNGMNLEGYGPVATGMGGASMAYDNGTAAMMNNPATLGMMGDGSRLDLAAGWLRPDVRVEAGPASWNSGGDSYIMPAVGWVKKQDRLAYGFGVFAQGGMGTEYGSGGPGGGAAAYNVANNITPAVAFGAPASPVTDIAGTTAWLAGQEERSEVGVARVMVPLSFNVNDKLNLGGSIDYVRATMDFKWLMPGSDMVSLMQSGNINGSMITSGLMPAFMAGGIRDIYGGYFDSSDSNDYNGNMVGSGFGGKLGFTYQLTPKLSIGGTYHSKTHLDDLEGDAKIAMAMTIDTGYFSTGTVNGVLTDVQQTLTGKMKILDFQWPETYGIGFAYQEPGQWMIAADIKRIRWSGVMNTFDMTFTADNSAANGGFAGTTMDASLDMNWKDQNVIEIGGAYNVSEQLVLRAGYNRANNTVPDSTLHYLFPAIEETHYTAGLGYAFNDVSSVDLSAAYAPEVSQTNPAGFTVKHSQLNWQFMYSHRF